ncbi:peptidyl-prolyl cis-trans isomerase PASTICCINO1 isoform X1 [Oryza glaberrima]|uniref:peptidyl-prolyl cis-trans isomerase PASTICCINO1 isoform X1 n=1 Tax=Oryza glaberrima TaxID=4538 RepID=UPI00224C132D|nr:peptidyl-prolyl cis-trans isomerase PASTICCINO1 isoform X1 [Oryza glaberrima]
MAHADADAGDLPPPPAKKKKSPAEEEAEKRRKKLTPGSLMKGLIRSGGGDATPAEGDQVIVHCTTRTIDGIIFNSTRREHGGKGVPLRFVLGKSKMILGFAEGFPTMLMGEIAMFKMKPQIHYAEEDCPVTAPDGFPKDDELQFEIEMLDFFKAKIVAEDLGVVKKIIDEGKGWETPREPYEVTARITARTGDGKELLPSKEEPYFFTIGKSEVPKGLEMGIGSMAREEKAIIYVTSAYLTNSSLIPQLEGIEEVQFEVELVQFVQVRDMLGDGRLIKRRVVDGKGEFPMDCPLHDSLLRVHYKGMLLDEPKSIFYDTRVDNHGEPLEFCSGEGLVPEGFEMCVRLMLPGEKSIVTCPPDFAYDKFPRPANVPEGAHVQWEIELLGFEMPKDWTGFTFQEIMDDAEKIKTTFSQGNRLFKEGKFELAKAKYEKVLREYNHVHPQDDDEGKIFANSRSSLHLNVAACYQKMGEYRKSIDTCNKVLEANPVHVKALYRRGMSYMLLGDFDDAKKDFEKMIAVDKSSEPDATAALNKLKQTIQETEKKARKQFKGLFDKKPGEISEVGVGEPEGNKTDTTGSGEAASTADRDTDAKEAIPRADSGLAFEEERPGLLARIWPSASRIFSSLGLNRCTIL